MKTIKDALEDSQKEVKRLTALLQSHDIDPNGNGKETPAKVEVFTPKNTAQMNLVTRVQ